VGLRTGGRRAKSLKNRVKSSKIKLRFREVWSQSRSSRSTVLQEIISLSGFISAKKPSLWEGFLYIRGFCAARQGFSHKNLEYDKKEE